MFRNYLIVAFRNIRKYKFFSFINIAGLTIGMACASGVDVPLCRYAVASPAKNAHVSWIKIIHGSDLGFGKRQAEAVQAV